jgi:hypothetical protein
VNPRGVTPLGFEDDAVAEGLELGTARGR